MLPTLQVAVLWALLTGFHVVVRKPSRRNYLRKRFGKGPYGAVFGLISLALFAPLLVTIATHYHSGPMLYDLRRFQSPELPWLRWLTIALNTIGLSFLVQPAWKPGSETRIRGLLRITRNPPLTGWSLFAIGHLLQNGSLFDVVAFGGFFVYPAFAAWQNEQHAAREPAASFEDVRDVTSLVPFAAMIRGDQRLSLREIPWARMVPIWIFVAGFYVHHQQILALLARG